jgi:hypothetical protein
MSKFRECRNERVVHAHIYASIDILVHGWLDPHQRLSAAFIYRFVGNQIAESELIACDSNTRQFGAHISLFGVPVSFGGLPYGGTPCGAQLPHRSA